MPHRVNVDETIHQATAPGPPATAAGLPVRVPGATEPPPRAVTGDGLAARVHHARPETAQRALLSVAAMHEPDAHGQCRWCRPEAHGWLWWRRSQTPCPTRRVIDAELRTHVGAEPRWMPA